ncbi:hypothetical protein [Campylobacter avium]|uniref:hypothetical protein n=1 Tax=Campylobacter avium TaxID=522485 RepID=UPI0023524A88|nr:hypothetical protein [Campylobacter avium]
MNEKKQVKAKITELENYVKEAKENIQKCEQVIEALKDIVWDRKSKKESSQMYKVLKDDKTYTQVKSNVGDIKVDKDFMQKEIKKHLDNPKLRGMISTKEMLSFPKVVKNVRAKYNPQQQGFDWKVRANDDSLLVYGERDYGDGHRLLTAHSKTERGERGHSHRQIKDPDFHNSVTEILTNSKNESQAKSREQELDEFRAKLKEVSKKIKDDEKTKNLNKDIEI